MSYPTIPTVLPLIRDDAAREYLRLTYDAAISAGAHGTMRAWMQAHDGATVDTLQCGATPWAPLGRTVNAARATYVEFDGSRRDYAGCRVVGVTETALVVWEDWGDGREIMFTTTN